MSLQRIIELARRQGMPVILTDVAGREPMVVLPLEAYEKMLDGDKKASGVRDQASVQGGGQDHSMKQQVVSPDASSLTPEASPPDGLRVRQRDEDRVQALHRSLDTVSHEVPAQQLPQKEGGEGLVLEERFSFQP